MEIIKKSELADIRLTPVNGGTIIVFNSIQQGKYGQLFEQITEFERDLNTKEIPVTIERFTAFGPFDNIIRFDVDDFCWVSQISSLAGVSSQQIQCAYSIWPPPDSTKTSTHWKPFCCITQLKVQNHLMLGQGPEIEEAIGQLVAKCLQEYLETDPQLAQDIDVELMATLGWDEFFIFMRNSRGYASMFKPILEKIRPLTIKDLEEQLHQKFIPALQNAPSQDKHLFLSTYSTPGFSTRLNKYIEDELSAMIEKRGKENEGDTDIIISGKEFDLEALLKKKIPGELSEFFGADPINASIRLSIKPGHWDKVSQITRRVMAEAQWGYQEPMPPIDRIFSIGRYDVYPFLDAQITCKEFITYFTVLIFALAGNLKKEEDYSKFLKRTQFYNSYTVVSCPCQVPVLDANKKGSIDRAKTTEGTFVSQLKELALSGHRIDKMDKMDKKTIGKAFESNEFLNNQVPQSIINGLSRIFSLFDSCIMDRFTCDTFIDMYPFMQRIRDIIDTVEEDINTPGKPLFFFTKPTGMEKPSMRIELPESWEKPDSAGETLVRTFFSAIQRFSQGFVHRYLSSYPMMDKNETGVDFSGRLHRILSAVTGMQNLLLDDLDCHIKKGFNSISTYPSIRIYRDSFNTTEATVFHLFQVESFFTLFHESIHTFIHSEEEKGKRLLSTLEEPINGLRYIIPEESLDIFRLILEEVTGDLFALKNACYSDFTLFGFWYWLMLIQCKNKIDSQILLRFLVISYHLHPKSREIINRYSSNPRHLSIETPEQLIEMMDKLLSNDSYPHQIKANIQNRITAFTATYFNSPQKIYRFNYAFTVLSEMLNAIYRKLDNSLECCCYPPEEGEHAYPNQWLNSPQRPRFPEKGKNEKRQKSSILLFRCLLTFIYENREEILCQSDGILNFRPVKRDLRLKLFKYRITLTNTLQWESLYWKKALLEAKGIKFPMTLQETQGE